MVKTSVSTGHGAGAKAIPGDIGKDEDPQRCHQDGNKVGFK